MPFDTSILYLDRHTDTRRTEGEEECVKFDEDYKKDIYHGHVYPHVGLEHGKGVPLIGWVDHLNGPKYYWAKEDGRFPTPHFYHWKYMTPENYTHNWESAPFEPGVYPRPDPTSLRNVSEIFSKGTKQLHIDPDFFSYDGLLRLAGFKVPPKPRKNGRKRRGNFYFDGNGLKFAYNLKKKDADHHDLIFDDYARSDVSTVSSTFNLIKMMNPDFLGLFEFYAGKAKGKNKYFAKKVILNIVEKAEPVKHIVVDRSILRNIPGLRDELESMGEIIYGPGYSGELIKRRKYEREPDLKSIMKDGKTFGVFDSHISAIMTWDIDAVAEKLLEYFI